MDVIDLLREDHQKVQDLLGRVERGEVSPESEVVEEIVRALSVHAGLEELIVYPAVKEAVPGGSLMIDEHLLDHQLVKELLVEIERSSGADRITLLNALASDVRLHVEHEEGNLFPRLRDRCSNEQREQMAATWEKAKRIAPTHPHPHAPRTRPANIVADLAAGLLDKARDALRR